MTRRDLLATLIGNAMVPRLQGQEDDGQPELEGWMRQVYHTRSLVGRLTTDRFVEPIVYLTEPLVWFPNPGQTFEKVEVPRGFVSDFASIPRAFWSALRPDGEYAHVAVIHDYLYWTQTRSREESDMIFKFAMQDLRINAFTIEEVYRPVRVAGGFSWSANQRLRDAGEKRILTRFPDKTQTSMRWAEWKKEPANFQ